MTRTSFELWLQAFVSTGETHPLDSSWTRERLREFFGEPDAYGVTSRRYRTPRVMKYGTCEFHFGLRADAPLILIYIENENGEASLSKYIS